MIHRNLDILMLYKIDNAKCEKDIIEKAHIYFFKQSLGVNKQRSNVGCRNELGRFPLQHIINTAIVRYLYYLKELPDNYIAKQCLQMCKDMSAKHQTICKELTSLPIITNL